MNSAVDRKLDSPLTAAERHAQDLIRAVPDEAKRYQMQAEWNRVICVRRDAERKIRKCK